MTYYWHPGKLEKAYMEETNWCRKKDPKTLKRQIEKEYELTIVEHYHNIGETYHTWLSDKDGALYLYKGEAFAYFYRVGDKVTFSAKVKYNAKLDGKKYSRLWYPRNIKKEGNGCI